MSVLAQDDFAGTGALSASWTALSGDSTWSRVAGIASHASCSAEARYDGVSAPANQYCQVVVVTPDTTSDAGSGPQVRCRTNTTTTPDCYFLQGNTVETRIYKRTGGSTYVQLGSDGPAITLNDVLYLEIQGTTLVAKKNGTSICGSPITDSGIASGNAGMWGCRGTLDSFEVGDFGSTDTLMGAIWL